MHDDDEAHEIVPQRTYTFAGHQRALDLVDRLSVAGYSTAIVGEAGVETDAPPDVVRVLAEPGLTATEILFQVRPRAGTMSAWPLDGTLLKVDGTSEELQPAGDRWTLAEWQAAVGGNVELIHLLGGRWALLVDEEGLLKGLSENRRASDVARRSIVGPALLLPENAVRDCGTRRG